MGSSQRITLEHIQSGEKGLVTSFAEAADWINARAGERTCVSGDCQTASPAEDDRKEGARCDV
jgi:hypothetical protein